MSSIDMFVGSDILGMIRRKSFVSNFEKFFKKPKCLWILFHFIFCSTEACFNYFPFFFSSLYLPQFLYHHYYTFFYTKPPYALWMNRPFCMWRKIMGLTIHTFQTLFFYSYMIDGYFNFFDLLHLLSRLIFILIRRCLFIVWLF